MRTATAVPCPRCPPPCDPEALRRWREGRGLTQRQLAVEVGVRRCVVSHWESGRREPTTRYLRALARLGAPVRTQRRPRSRPGPAPGSRPRTLREWRIKHDLDQDQLAVRLGVSAATVCRWETAGREPGEDQRRMLADMGAPVERPGDCPTVWRMRCPECGEVMEIASDAKPWPHLVAWLDDHAEAEHGWSRNQVTVALISCVEWERDVEPAGTVKTTHRHRVMRGDWHRRLRRWRQASDLTRLELATELRVSISTVQRWESGKVRPDRNVVPRLMRLGAPEPPDEGDEG